MCFNDLINENRNWIEQTFEKLNAKLSKVAIKSRNKIPYSTVNGVHDDKSKTKPGWWTNGFWGGLMWLMYEATGNEDYRKTAETSEKILDQSIDDFDEIHHDVGFMWNLVSGASYRLTGNKRSRARMLIAAAMLASRYNVQGNFIRAWNISGSEGWTIIDSMMNISLLYRASKELKDDRFRHVAVRQADMSVRDHVRKDGTINHIVVHDVNKPDVVLETKGGQGYAVGSCWSRGQSWAVYGFVLSYIHTGDKKYLETAKKTADVFVRETEKTNWLPRCDFNQPEKPDKWDSTAGAIASCGLIEIANNCDSSEREKYLSAAVNILKAMEKEWCDWTDNKDSILQMGLESYSAPYHKDIIYGDFFFTEAILKLKGSKFLIW